MEISDIAVKSSRKMLFCVFSKLGPLEIMAQRAPKGQHAVFYSDSGRERAKHTVVIFISAISHCNILEFILVLLDYVSLGSSLVELHMIAQQSAFGSGSDRTGLSSA